MKQLGYKKFIKIVYQEYSKIYQNTKGNETLFSCRFLGVLFLVEWKYCLEFNKKPSKIIWIKDLTPIIKKPNFSDFISPFTCVEIGKNNHDHIHCSNFDLLIVIKWVLQKISHKTDSQISHLINCTYPFITSNKNKELDLLALSIDYKISEKPKFLGVNKMINDLKNKKLDELTNCVLY